LSRFEGVDTVVLFDEMAYEDVLSVRWSPLSSAPSFSECSHFSQRNLKVLQVCAAAESQVAVDALDEKNPYASDLHRVEVKLNMALEVLGQLVAAQDPRPAPLAVRFNALGGVWHNPEGVPATGTQGLLRIYLQECLAQPLTLIATVLGCAEDGRVRAQFTPPGEPVAELIGKLAFRRHRRQVAGMRQHHRD